MRISKPILWAIVTLVLYGHPVDAAPQVAVGCGGFPLPYGTTIGAVGPRSGPKRPSSIMAVAAVTTETGLRPLAWTVWDERGFGWLAIDKRSPPDLRKLGKYQIPPDFTGPGRQVRFSVLPPNLPARYRLTDCPSVLPAR
jgi:hypothetical protein